MRYRIYRRITEVTCQLTRSVSTRPEPSGNIGTGQVAKAAPDGYTLVAVSSSMTANS